MNLEFDCIPCIFRQVLEASRMVTEDEKLIRDILNKYALRIPEIKMDESAPLIVTEMQNFIKEVTGKEDPYYNFKKRNIKKARELYSHVENTVKTHKDPLLAALLMSAMGNSIDAGVSLDVDIDGNIKNALKSGFKYSDYNKFLERLDGAKRVLIIADNAGEAVFDRLLIQELNKEKLDITYAVRDKAILNDVTLKEARDIGIDKYCKLISSGCDTPGLILDRVSSQFMKIYNDAEIIISKGQGNLEGLLGTEREIFFLMKVKCHLIAKKLGSGLEVGDFIFKLY